MPQYAVIADLAQGGVSNANTSEIPAATLDAVLLKRSVYADGYLGKRYTLPILAWGDDLRLAVSQLSGWDVMAVVLQMNPEDAANSNWRDRRDEAQRWLEGVAAGRIVPTGIVDSSPAEGADVGGPECLSEEPRGF